MNRTGKFDHIFIFAVLAFEALFFHTSYRREIASYLPNDFDQANYLRQSYALKEEVLDHGLTVLLHEPFRAIHATGLAFPIEGAFLGVLLNGTRLAELLLNFLAVCVVQLALFYTAQDHWRRRSAGYLAIGLLLCESTVWLIPGGWLDFRIDFLAYCLYGLWTILIVRSGIFASRTWAAWAGLVGAVLVLNRFFTIIYLLGVSAGVAAYGVLAIVSRKSLQASAYTMRRRLWNIGLSQGLTLAIAGPFLVLNWKPIHDYYVIGHLTGQEKYIRAKEFHLSSWASHLLYYPRSLIADHLGTSFVYASILLTGFLAMILLLHRLGRRSTSRGNADRWFWLERAFLLTSVLGPLMALTLDVAKSPIVGGIVGVPVVLLITAIWSEAVGEPRSDGVRMAEVLVPIGAAVAFTIGFTTQLAHATTHFPRSGKDDLELATDLDVWIAKYAFDQGWQQPRFFTDVISPWFISEAISTCGYEKAHVLVAPCGLLSGSNILGVDRTTALKLLAESDLVLLTTLPKEGVYPFYSKITQYWPELKAWAEQNLIPVREVSFSNFVATVYSRPSAQVIGASGDWITSSGLVIRTERDVLERFPVLKLSGDANYSWLRKQPSAKVVLDVPKGAREVPASFRNDKNRWELIVDLRGQPLPAARRVSLEVKFDTFFVPRELGINEDTRELVVGAPHTVDFFKLSPTD